MHRPADRGASGTLAPPPHPRAAAEAGSAPAPDPEDWLATYLDEVEDVMVRALATGSSRAPAGLGAAPLWGSLAEATQGGKRFRPALLGVAYLAWGGRDVAAPAAVGAAVELLHTGFLVHDDVIDDDDIRRGRPSVLGAHAGAARARGVLVDQARSYGAAAAILAGDLALTAAVRTVATAPVHPAVVARLLDLFDEALRVSAEGELADVWLGATRCVATPEAAISVAEQKTAAYSFALPLQAAAVLAGRSTLTVAAAEEVGRCLGIAYQLVDDLQGVFGDLGVTGKSRLSDLRSGKQTALVAHARTTDAWPALEPYVGLATITEDQAAVARDLLTASGAREHVERLARGYVDRAVELAGGSGIPSHLVSWLANLGTGLLGSAA